ncbi:MAG: energy transducer TonB [Deltaproteobacteria bacterium]|nr:energy transducer TonB [Deltaproteobacteria bacterium]
MSIKTLKLTDNSQFILFLFISLLLHIGILFIVPQGKDGKKISPGLIPVDVIELPRPAQIKEPEAAEQKSEVKKEKPQALPPSRQAGSSPVFPVKKDLAKLPQEPLPTETKPVEEKTKQGLLTKEAPIGKKEISPSTSSLEEKKPLNLYPTGERLAELSEKYEKETPTAEKDKSISLNANEPRSISYLQTLKGMIKDKWEYPEAAARDGEAGRLWIRFIIRKEGTLEDVMLIKSSGYPMLDDAALSAIRLAAPFYPFPKSFGSLERITVNASFEYVLEQFSPLIRNRP